VGDITVWVKRLGFQGAFVFLEDCIGAIQLKTFSFFKIVVF
jgi:hypothetical protein